RTVNFKNTVVIMTSNIGSQYLMEGISADGSISENARELVMNELQMSFRPEFLNRLDETVMFKPLTMDEIIRIIDLILDRTRSKLAEQNITLEISDAAKKRIARDSYSPVYGARPVKRYVQKNVETQIARVIMRGEIAEGGVITIDSDDEKLTFRVKEMARV
ncbi:MAG: AAA domain-containing protein, partial [Clostridiales bacterium]|nr:AAA domain-containing protein [Clostridiales bacterium]